VGTAEQVLLSIGVVMANAQVAGEIRVAKPLDLPAEATIYVRLLDTSTADAPAVLVAEQVLRKSAEEANRSGKVSFQLRGGPIDASRDYTVSVLIDIDGDGRVSRGDFISIQSYPVLTRGHSDSVSIQVERVR
jgi:uncharacterized lipoprotein YbaY